MSKKGYLFLMLYIYIEEFAQFETNYIKKHW